MVTALTTFDNPFDPLKEFEKWFNFDTVVKGYNSCGYLARIARTSDQLSDAENEDEIERAIDEIVALNPTLYKKVVGK
jgi:hypothetical protein